MAKYRLLLIEDDYDVAEMLLTYFQSSGDYDVMHAGSGQEGIEIARTRFPNLILLDVMLPDMDGYEICYRLRNMSLTRYIPILFLTQKDERASKVKGLELGADDYITKPFDIDELRLRIEGALRRASRENLHEPRTGLPSASMVEAERQRRQNRARELRFVLHGFQAYSDVYGFIAGNEVLHFAGKTIRDTLSSHGRNDDFVGMEKEDFIILTSTRDTRALETQISGQFSQQVRAFYSFADSARGGILLKKGEEHPVFVPLMSLTTGNPEPARAEPDEWYDENPLAW
jgi:DNA-binding response OmpR family regulator